MGAEVRYKIEFKTLTSWYGNFVVHIVITQTFRQKLICEKKSKTREIFEKCSDLATRI